jgi:hypothetical protein
MVFLSIVTGICGIGTAAEFGRIGKQMLTRYLSFSFLGSAMAVMTLPLFSLPGTSSSGAAQSGGILELLLNILPSNPIQPFSDGNTLQIIFLAVFLGVILLGMGERSARIKELLQDFHSLVMQAVRVVCKLLPDKAQPEQEEFRLLYIQANLMQTPEISVLQAQKETGHFAQRVQQMFGLVRSLLEEEDDEAFAATFKKVEQQEDITDKMEIEIARYLEQVSDNHLSDITKMKVRQMLREISELESIGDACYNLARTLNRRHESGHDFTPERYDQLRQMMQYADDALTQMNVVMTGHSHEHDIRDTYRIENDINQLRQRLKTENVASVNNHEYDYAVGTLYVDMINELEKLGDYVVNVVEARFGK